LANAKTAALRAAFPLTIPVCTGYIFLGITYGMLMVTAGFPIWLPIFTAAIVYTGSMEFLLVAILVVVLGTILTQYRPYLIFTEGRLPI
jgi:4-azaleucine resistance transporter AzlC